MKSWVIPPATWPMASRRWTWRRARSTWRCSRTSAATTRTERSPEDAVGMGTAETEMSKPAPLTARLATEPLVATSWGIWTSAGAMAEGNCRPLTVDSQPSSMIAAQTV